MKNLITPEVTAKLNVVLLRCATRAERQNAARLAEKLASEVLAVAIEMQMADHA